jgi:hypothetical protein
MNKFKELATDIHQLANSFYKAAGLFQAPPAMVARFQKDVVDLYASAVMYRVKYRALQFRRDNPEYSKARQNVIDNFRNLFIAAKKYTSIAPRPPKYFSKLYNINLDGWKYFKPELKTLFNQWINEGLYDPQIKLRVIFKNYKHAGEYDNVEHSISIFIQNDYLHPNSVEHFYRLKMELEKTVRHELEHFSQFLLGNLLSKNSRPKANERGDVAGLPSSKLRTKQYDFLGSPVSSLGPDGINELQHSEIDIEFYTDLHDSIKTFMFHIPHILKGTRLEFLKCWVGEPNNFKNLSQEKINNLGISKNYQISYMGYVDSVNKVHSPFDVLKNNSGKWKKAVKVFYDAVRHSL